MTKPFKLHLLYFLLLGFILIPISTSYFTDLEASSLNQLKALAIDLEINAAESFDFSLTSAATEGKKIIIDNKTVTPTAYSQQYEFVSGNPLVCDQIKLKAWYVYYDMQGVKQEAIKYDNLLPGFKVNDLGNENDLTIPNQLPYYPNSDYSSSQHWWQYEWQLAEGVEPLINQSCLWKIKVTGWQDGQSMADGYLDEEELTSTITIN